MTDAEIQQHLTAMARTGQPSERKAIEEALTKLRRRLRERQAAGSDTGSHEVLPRLLPRPPYDKQ